MNRRFFLSKLALATVPAIVPAPLKFIFDLGANKHHYPEWKDFTPAIRELGISGSRAQYRIVGSSCEMRIVTVTYNPNYVEAPYEELIFNGEEMILLREKPVFTMKEPLVIYGNYEA